MKSKLDNNKILMLFFIFSPQKLFLNYYKKDNFLLNLTFMYRFDE